ncbi:hypothetical protein [Endozoicomonas sp. ALC066]|uniref:hypothetical protein n=1 Tax=Endozoicomonas sp. ALC066 TaxID=3403078 RepID=UPI003BB8072E
MSIFSKREPTITFEFVEAIQEALKDNPELSTLQALLFACDRTGRTKDDLEAVAVRLAEEKKESEERQEVTKSTKQGFGTSFLEWYSKLSPDLMCLMATGFDFEKARHLYCEVDKEVANEVLKAFSEHSWNEAHLRFEACLFGFGGGYGKGGSSTKGEENVVDATDMDADDLNAMLRGG